MKNEIAYCGIDVGLRKHSVCLIDCDQKIIKTYEVENDLIGFTKIDGDICKKTKICIEPTGIYSINIFLYFKNNGYDIKFCHTNSSHDFRQSMFRQKKHDYFDSVALAKYRIVNENKTIDDSKVIGRLSLDIYKSNSNYKELSDKCDEYWRISKDSVRLKNKIKGIIDLRFPEAIQIFSCDRGCKSIINALLHSKEEVLSGKLKLRKAEQIKEKLRNSIGQYDLKVDDFRVCANDLFALEEKIKEIKDFIEIQINKLGYSFMLDCYGLSTINSAVIVKEIKEISRFYRYSDNGCFNKKRSLKAFKKFVGLTVTSNQSGEKQGGHKLAKTGNKRIRNVLFMLALSCLSEKPNESKINAKSMALDPLKYRAIYERLVQNGSKKMIAVTKIMSKVATDLFFLLKENEDTKIKNT